MSGRSPIWRSIMWVEQFLPTPTTALPDAKQAAAAKRRAFLPFVVLPLVMVPVLLRNRRELAALVHNHLLGLQQVLLVFAVVAAVAAVAAGVITWRREMGR